MDPEKKEDVDRKNELLRKLILTKLRTIKKEKFEPKTIDKFSLTFRVFLLRYLNLQYEFTLEELALELNKTKTSTKLKERIIALLNLLTEIKYENREISKEEFKSSLNEAVGIVNLAVGKIEREKIRKKVKKGLLFTFLRKLELLKKEKKSIKKKKFTKEKQKRKLKALKKRKELISNKHIKLKKRLESEREIKKRKRIQKKKKNKEREDKN